MINEDYCSYEVAKLLKEKGFDGECETSYYISNEGCENAVSVGDFTKVRPWREALIAAPTHQMAMKWLREKQIYIRIIEDAFGKSFRFEVYSKNPNVIVNYYIPNYYKDTYEDAVEAALKYALENLI